MSSTRMSRRLAAAHRLKRSVKGTTLKKIDDYTVEWTFKEAFPKQYLYRDGLPGLLPGPVAYPEDRSIRNMPKNDLYDQFKNGVPRRNSRTCR
jgi:ABC-type transport system substrate-binding protein